MSATKRLIHYTKNPKAVAGILRHGFAWVPNRRNLIDKLLPRHDFSAREPQQFGMISFTEIDGPEHREHREMFGPFGIAVTRIWASAQSAQRVIYVEETGPLFDALRDLFSLAYEDLRSRVGSPSDQFRQMAYTNRAMSQFLGGQVYASLLTIYEYLEPAKHAGQQEWRIVNLRPLYGFRESTQDVIKDISPPRGWDKMVKVLKVRPSDVECLICPPGEAKLLRESIPKEWRDIPMEEW